MGRPLVPGAPHLRALSRTFPEHMSPVYEKGASLRWCRSEVLQAAGRAVPSLRSAPSAARPTPQGCPSSQEEGGGTQSPANFRQLLSTSPK